MAAAGRVDTALKGIVGLRRWAPKAVLAGLEMAGNQPQVEVVFVAEQKDWGLDQVELRESRGRQVSRLEGVRG